MANAKLLFLTVPTSQVALVVKYTPANAGDIRAMDLIPNNEETPGEGHGNPLQYSCVENSVDRGAWQLQSMESQRGG